MTGQSFQVEIQMIHFDLYWLLIDSDRLLKDNSDHDYDYDYDYDSDSDYQYQYQYY